MERKNLAKEKLIGGYTDCALAPANIFTLDALRKGRYDDWETKKLMANEKILNEIMHAGIGTRSLENTERFLMRELDNFSEAEKTDYLRWEIARSHYELICSELEHPQASPANIVNKALSRISGSAHQYETDRYGILNKGFNKNVYYSFDKKNTAKPDNQSKGVVATVGRFFKNKMDNINEKHNKSFEESRLTSYSGNMMIFTCLKQLGKCKKNKEENIDFILEFWAKNGNPIFRNIIADTLSEIDPNLSAKKLLEFLKRAKNDSEEKDRLTVLLFRLELGQLGISEDGVNYLGKIYDVGEYNDPKNFVQRLTGMGDIGIFDDNRILQKYFTLDCDELINEEKIIKADLKDFTINTLFFKKKNETDEERIEREKYLNEFLENYFEFYNDDFFKKTNVSFNNLNFKEQGWFLIYFKNTDDNEKKQLIDFAKIYGESGLKTFLSLESGRHMGSTILDIGEQLKQDPETANALFTEFGNIIDSAGINTDRLVEIYNSIFYDKQIDRDEANYSIMKKAYELLFNVSIQIKEDDSFSGKNEAVTKAIDSIRSQDHIQKKAIEDLAALAEKFNGLYTKAHDIMLYGSQERADLQPEIMRKYKENGGEFSDYLQAQTERRKKFDSERIITLIDQYKRQTDAVDKFLEKPEFIKKYFNDSVENAIQQLTKSKKYNHKVILQLQKLLVLQRNLEQKLDQFVYGQEQAGLPDNFEKGIEGDIAEYRPELSPSDRPYFPVGISSSLPKKGEKHAKPIDSLAYLFWLKNQGVPAELMVVDTIQTTNYQASYGLSEKEAREKALENGERDKDFYRSAIEAHGLGDAISLTDYRQVEEYSKTREYQDLVDSLDDKKRCAPIARALNGLVEGSRRRDAQEEGNESNEEKDRKDTLLRSYGKSEIAFILSKPEMKVGHEKEFRYDIIASVIPIFKSLEDNLLAVGEILKKNGIKNTTQHTSTQELIDLSFYLARFSKLKDDEIVELLELFQERSDNRNKLSAARKEKKELGKSNFPDEDAIRKADKNIKDLQFSASKLREKAENRPGNVSLIFKLSETTQDGLKLINKNPQEIMSKWRNVAGDITETEWYKKISLPKFYYPKGVNSQSFEMKKEGKDEIIGFREPYSTYKSGTDEELMVEANQMLVSMSKLVPAKFMVLSHEKQLEYFEKVLKPLLVNYYLATSSSKDMAKARFNKDFLWTRSRTVADVVRIVQHKIISPIKGIV
jgi:hypothetical protein